VVLLAANARIVWVVLLTVADPVDLATSAAAARAGAAAGATPVVGATSSAGGMSAKSKSDASNDMVADVGSAFELGDVVAPTGPGADDAVAGNVEADDAPPGIVPAGDAPAVGAPVADAATGNVPGGTLAGAGPRAEVGPPLAGARSPTLSLAGFPDRDVFPARREITAASTIPAATITMTNTS